MHQRKKKKKRYDDAALNRIMMINSPPDKVDIREGNRTLRGTKPLTMMMKMTTMMTMVIMTKDDESEDIIRREITEQKHKVRQKKEDIKKNSRKPT